jgi:hypothetical protein
MDALRLDMISVPLPDTPTIDELLIVFEEFVWETRVINILKVNSKIHKIYTGSVSLGR